MNETIIKKRKFFQTQYYFSSIPKKKIVVDSISRLHASKIKDDIHYELNY